MPDETHPAPDAEPVFPGFEPEPEPQEAEVAPDDEPQEPRGPRAGDDDETQVDRLAWALCQDEARDELEIRRGRKLGQSTYVDTWPGEAILDLERRLDERLPEGTYTVVVRDEGARVIRSGQFLVMSKLRGVARRAVEPDSVERPGEEPPDSVPVEQRPSVTQLADEVQRRALEHYTRAAEMGTPEAYERVRVDAFEDGYQRGKAEAADPDAPSGWSLLERVVGMVEAVGKEFVGGIGLGFPSGDDEKGGE